MAGAPFEVPRAGRDPRPQDRDKLTNGWLRRSPCDPRPTGAQGDGGDRTAPGMTTSPRGSGGGGAAGGGRTETRQPTVFRDRPPNRYRSRRDRCCDLRPETVLTDAASIHGLAGKRVFDAHPAEWARGRGATLEAFDPVADYRAPMAGRPPNSGVAAILAARGIERAVGCAEDPPELQSVWGLVNRKREAFGAVMAVHAVAVRPPAVDLLLQLRAAAAAAARPVPGSVGPPLGGAGNGCGGGGGVPRGDGCPRRRCGAGRPGRCPGPRPGAGPIPDGRGAVRPPRHHRREAPSSRDG